MAKILIVGCGAIGRELGIVLTRAGHHVVGFKRTVPSELDLPFDLIRADITRAKDIDQIDNDYDAVYIIISPGARNIETYRAVYETGIGNLAAKLFNPSTTVIFVSSTSVYGQTQGEWVDEESPTTPAEGTSQSILSAEQTIRALGPKNIVVRFSGIYGPGREYLLRMARQTPEIQKDPPYYTNRIHQTDCVRVLAFLLDCRLKNLALEQCYLASDDDPAPMWEVIGWIAEKIHCPAPLDKAVEHNVDMNKRCRNSKLKQLGFSFAYPDFKTGYGELISLKKE